jgi:8-oxo-dGTP pyrophosphatase MutT (NUDIX family)
MALDAHITVAAVVERHGQYLLVEELAGSNLVRNQPAGHLEEGESLEQAVIRETREETGYAFVPEAVVGIYLWRSASGATYLRVAFSGHVTGTPDTPLDPDIVRADWFSPEELRQDRVRLRSPLVMRCIEDHANGRQLPLSALAHLTES